MNSERLSNRSRISSHFYGGSPTSTRSSLRSSPSHFSRSLRNKKKNSFSSNSNLNSNNNENNENNNNNINLVLKSQTYWMRDDKKTLHTIKNVFGSQTTSLPKPEERYCIECLNEGCIEAFNLLFEISHRKPVIIDSISEKKSELTRNDLKYLKNILIQSEKLKISGQFQKSYHSFKEIADFFESKQDLKTALFFHKKGQKLAKTSGDLKIEGLAFENLGKMYERQGQMDQAIKAHESHLNLAKMKGDKEEIRNTIALLVKSYSKKGQNWLKIDNVNKALTYFEKAHRVTTSIQDHKLLMETSFQLGKIYQKVDEFDKAIQYLEKYLSLCEKHSDHVGITNAQSELGSLYERQGQNEKALEIYQNFVKTTEENINKENEKYKKIENQKLMGMANEKLGLLFVKMGKTSEAVNCFQLNYKLAQESNDTEWINKSRISLGLAKGQQMFQNQFSNKIK